MLLTTHYLEGVKNIEEKEEKKGGRPRRTPPPGSAIMDQGRIVVHGTMAEVLGRGAGRVAFELPDGVTAEGPGGRADGDVLTVTGRRCVIATAELEYGRPYRAGLGRPARRCGSAGLDVRQATLEEIFLDVAESRGQGVRA